MNTEKTSKNIFTKNHPLREDMKLKLLLCISITFGALGNKVVDDDNHIFNFFTGGLEKSVILHRALDTWL